MTLGSLPSLLPQYVARCFMLSVYLFELTNDESMRKLFTDSKKNSVSLGLLRLICQDGISQARG